MIKPRGFWAQVAKVALVTLTVPFLFGAGTQQAFLTGIDLAQQGTSSVVKLHLRGVYTFAVTGRKNQEVEVELGGVMPQGVPASRQWRNNLLQGYRLVSTAAANGAPALSVHLQTHPDVDFKLLQEADGLTIYFTGKAASAIVPGMATQPAKAMTSSPHFGTIRSGSPVAGAIARLQNVSIESTDSAHIQVKILTTHPVQFTSFRLSHPQRLVVDLTDVRLVGWPKTLPSRFPLIKDVRISQFSPGTPAIVRLVADLADNVSCQVSPSPEGVMINTSPREKALASYRNVGQVKDKALRTVAAADRHEAVPAARALKSRGPEQPRASRAGMPPIRAQAFDALAKRPRSYDVAVSAVAPSPLFAMNIDLTKPVKVDLSGLARLTSPANAATYPEASAAAPAENPAPLAKAGTANGALAAGRALTALLSDAQRARLAAQVAAGSAKSAAPPPETKNNSAGQQYTGELISLDLKEVDLKDFFRLIHQISGLNVIIDPNVSGTLTLVLDDVPWDQALDIVLKNNGLGKVLEGNVLRIARIDTLTQEQKQAARLQDARLDSEPLTTIFRPLNYAKAMDVSALLKTWVGGGALSRRGTVQVDQRTNTLIVTDIQSQIPAIQSILNKLDRKTRQVSIEARIIQANANFVRSLSTVLSPAWNNRSGSTAVAGAIGQGAVGVANTSNPLPPVTPQFQQPSVAANGFGAFAITNSSARYAINAAIAAAETRSQAKTISRPSIVTQDNVKGMVQQGVQIPIQTNINNTISVQYVNATLQLTVTPQVTEDGHIFLNIIVNNASVGTILSFAGPSINTQQATTQVLVPDGGTVVFGGITVTSRSRSATYVPFLGSIPVIGNLFKSSSINDQDQELLFFVSPKVLPG